VPYCSSCGSEVTSDLRFCPNCGKELQSRTGSSLDIERPKHPRSAWWYLLPIIFGIIGGIIAYFVLRDDDEISKELLVVRNNPFNNWMCHWSHYWCGSRNKPCGPILLIG
jgi:zinc-ribbon domain